MRLLLLLLVIGVAASFTVPTREAHEEEARLFLEARAHADTSARPAPGFSIEGAVDFVTGMLAGEGRYENFYVMSKFTADLPGNAYVECYGAFTLVRCSEAGAGV